MREEKRIKLQRYNKDRIKHTGFGFGGGGGGGAGGGAGVASVKTIGTPTSTGGHPGGG